MGLFSCLLLGMCSGWIIKSFHPRYKKLSYRVVLTLGLTGGSIACVLVMCTGREAMGRVYMISLLFSIVIGASLTFLWILKSHFIVETEEAEE